jgi:hypothetical protein
VATVCEDAQGDNEKSFICADIYDKKQEFTSLRKWKWAERQQDQCLFLCTSFNGAQSHNFDAKSLRLFKKLLKQQVARVAFA